jgi:hypothetical protein
VKRHEENSWKSLNSSQRAASGIYVRMGKALREDVCPEIKKG